MKSHLHQVLDANRADCILHVGICGPLYCPTTTKLICVVGFVCLKNKRKKDNIEKQSMKIVFCRLHPYHNCIGQIKDILIGHLYTAAQFVVSVCQSAVSFSCHHQRCSCTWAPAVVIIRG
jgi:hypothetical protein